MKFIVSEDKFSEYPTVNPELPRSDIKQTLGDLQGNFLYLLWFVVKQGIVKISEENYDELAALYGKIKAYGEHSKDDLTGERCPLEKADVERFKAIITGLTVTRTANLDLIGDVIGDRGACDEFTCRLLGKLWEQGVDLSILLSNHDLAVLTEQLSRDPDKWGKRPSSYRSTRKYVSSRHTCQMAMKGITDFDYRRFLKDVYLPHIKLLDVVVDSEGEIQLYSHAPVGLEVVIHLAHKLNVEIDIGSPGKLIETVDKINAAYLTGVMAKLDEDPVSRTAFLLGDEASHQEDDMSPSNYEPPATGMICPSWEPVLALVWNRQVSQGMPTPVYRRLHNGEEDVLPFVNSTTTCCASLDEARTELTNLYRASGGSVLFHLSMGDAANYTITNIHGHEAAIVPEELLEQAKDEICNDLSGDEHDYLQRLQKELNKKRGEQTTSDDRTYLTSKLGDRYSSDLEKMVSEKATAMLLEKNPSSSYLSHCRNLDSAAKLVRDGTGCLWSEATVQHACKPTQVVCDMQSSLVRFAEERITHSIFHAKNSFVEEKMDSYKVSIEEKFKRYFRSLDQILGELSVSGRPALGAGVVLVEVDVGSDELPAALKTPGEKLLKITCDRRNKGYMLEIDFRAEWAVRPGGDKDETIGMRWLLESDAIQQFAITQLSKIRTPISEALAAVDPGEKTVEHVFACKAEFVSACDDVATQLGYDSFDNLSVGIEGMDSDEKADLAARLVYAKQRGGSGDQLHDAPVPPVSRQP